MFSFLFISFQSWLQKSIKSKYVLTIFFRYCKSLEYQKKAKIELYSLTSLPLYCENCQVFFCNLINLSTNIELSHIFFSSRNHIFLSWFLLLPIPYFYLVHDMKPPNNQFCFPQHFPRAFLSLISCKRKTFYWSKKVFFSVWD